MYALYKTLREEPLFTEQKKLSSNIIPLVHPGLGSQLQRRLLYMHLTSFDWTQGGLKSAIKFLDRDNIEYSLIQAALHDRNEEKMARKSLDGGLSLIDREWGGIYQYSTGNCWEQPSYIKSMRTQAGCLRLYSLAYALLHEHRYLNAARLIHDFMKYFLLSPAGAFYAGQGDEVPGVDKREYFKLDNEQRVSLGIPEIDTHLYARENAWAIESLASFYEFSGHLSALDLCIDASEWLINNCLHAAYKFRNRPEEKDLMSLDVALACGRAFLQLYRVTGKQKYLYMAKDSAEFITRRMKYPGGGYYSKIRLDNSFSLPPQIDENISLCRFFNLLAHYVNDARFRKNALHCMRYLSVPQVATARIEEAGILIVDEELNSKPVKIVIVGHKNDKQARKLFDTALRAFGWYKDIQWQSPDTSLHTADNFSLEKESEARAYVKNDFYTSDPVFETAKLSWLIKSI